MERPRGGTGPLSELRTMISECSSGHTRSNGYPVELAGNPARHPVRVAPCGKAKHDPNVQSLTLPHACCAGTIGHVFPPLEMDHAAYPTYRGRRASTFQGTFPAGQMYQAHFSIPLFEGLRAAFRPRFSRRGRVVWRPRGIGLPFLFDPLGFFLQNTDPFFRTSRFPM